MTLDPDLLLPSRIVGPSLTVAGLAAWVFMSAGREQEAERTRDLQDLIDAALRQGAAEVRASRSVVSHAADLWEEAARVADAWAGTAESDRAAAEWGRPAERLRVLAGSLRELLL